MKNYIQRGDENFKLFATPEEVEKKLLMLAGKIIDDIGVQSMPPVLLYVLRGGMYPGTILSRHLDSLKYDHEVDSMCIQSYTDNKPSGKIKLLSAPLTVLSGRHIIVVEDIVDTGASVTYVKNYLQEKAPDAASVRILSLCARTFNHKIKFPTDYVGFRIEETGHIIGTGLDFNNCYRGVDGLYIQH